MNIALLIVGVVLLIVVLTSLGAAAARRLKEEKRPFAFDTWWRVARDVQPVVAVTWGVLAMTALVLTTSGVLTISGGGSVVHPPSPTAAEGVQQQTPATTRTPLATPTRTAAPTPAPTRTPAATPTPTPSCPQEGTLVYEADWSDGPNGWPMSAGWKWLSGMLINDGSNGDNSAWVAAPYRPMGCVADNYAVEAEVQMVGELGCMNFAIVARDKYQGGVRFAWNPFYCNYGNEVIIRAENEEPSASAPFSFDNAWHSYRLEVKDTHFRLLVDGAVMVEWDDNRYLTGNVGLWSRDTQVDVRSFRVVAL